MKWKIYMPTSTTNNLFTIETNTLKTSTVLFNKAVDLFQNGIYNEAIDAYKKVIELNPSFFNAYYDLALVYASINQIDAAISTLKEAITLNNGDATAYNNLGVLYFKKNMHNDAGVCFEKALTIDTSYKEAQQNLEKVSKLRAKTPQCTSVETPARIHQNKHLNIGFVSLWFERGQSYVTKTLRDVIATEYNTFVFARTGNLYDHPRVETGGMWAVPNLNIFHDYDIPHKVIDTWIDKNTLDIIVFNEEYDWGLVDFCKRKGLKVITYLDYYKDDWKSSMYLYDAVLCSTKRTFNLVKDFCNAYYIGWGIDTDLFKPSTCDGKKYTFFHNAGWLGINYRKMTPAVILAFDTISRYNPDATLFVHTQVELEKLPPQIVQMVRNNSQITYHVETLPAPGLYHKGSILVFPSKLEGLGLPLLEGMACGLPAIATDAPPMNDFVQDGYNGLLVKVAQKLTRQDNIAFPEEIIDINDLILKMDYLIKNPELVNKMQKNARDSINNYATLSKKVNEVINIVQQKHVNIGTSHKKLQSITNNQCLNFNARHILPSYVLSLDDEPFCPNHRLIELGLASATRASKIDLRTISQLFPKDTARFINVWPGEHYRLLAAIVLEMKPHIIIEIGTATRASCLSMKKYLPQGGKIITYDIIPWDKYPGSGLKCTDFDSQLEQRVIDLTNKEEAFLEFDVLKTADLIFVDAAKDGQMEQNLCDLFDSIPFYKNPIVIFDDIKFTNMINIWRNIQHSKLDLTSFGHWSGTGLVDWC